MQSSACEACPLGLQAPHKNENMGMKYRHSVDSDAGNGHPASSSSGQDHRPATVKAGGLLWAIP